MLGASGYFYHVSENGLVRQEAATGSWATQGASINAALEAVGFGPYDTAVVETRYNKGETIPGFNNYYRI